MWTFDHSIMACLRPCTYKMRTHWVVHRTILPLPHEHTCHSIKRSLHPQIKRLESSLDQNRTRRPGTGFMDNRLPAPRIVDDSSYETMLLGMCVADASLPVNYRILLWHAYFYKSNVEKRALAVSLDAAVVACLLGLCAQRAEPFNSTIKVEWGWL